MRPPESALAIFALSLASAPIITRKEEGCWEVEYDIDFGNGLAAIEEVFKS